MRLSPRTTDFRCFLLCYIIQDFIIRYNAIYGTACTFFRARNRRDLLHYLLQFESLFVYSLVQSVHLISSKICQKVPKTGTFSVAIDVFGFFVLTTVNRRVVSSSLTWGATSSQASPGLRRLFCFTNKSSLRFVPLRLLSAKGHARFACSLASALTTALCRYQPFAGKSVINRYT